MTDDDIRSMLRAKADEATVSPDAWDRISARLGEPEHTVSQLPRRLAAVGVAAAAVAGIVVLANRPDPGGPTAQATTTSSFEVPAVVDVGEVRAAVDEWLASRVPGVDAGTYDTVTHPDGTLTVRFKDDGRLATELLLQPLSGRKGYGVVSASSDLVLIDNPTYDGSEVVAEAVPAVEGQLTTTYVIDGEDHRGGTRPVTHETAPLGYPVTGAQGVVVRVVLVTTDGMTAVAEQRATVLRDPATVTGSYVAVWPATDAVGLAGLQQQADNDRRPDLLDPQAVAGGALAELLPRGETSTGYALGDFQLGDQTSGEVPYTLSDGGSGTVLLRRTSGSDTRIWYVTGVTSDVLEVLKYRHEPGTLVIDVRSTATGTLTLPGGSAPVDVQAGQKVSISRPADDDIQTGRPVGLRLLLDGTTLGVVAELPR